MNNSQILEPHVLAQVMGWQQADDLTYHDHSGNKTMTSKVKDSLQSLYNTASIPPVYCEMELSGFNVVLTSECDHDGMMFTKFSLTISTNEPWSMPTPHIVSLGGV